MGLSNLLWRMDVMHACSVGDVAKVEVKGQLVECHGRSEARPFAGSREMKSINSSDQKQNNKHTHRKRSQIRLNFKIDTSLIFF